MEEMLRQLQDSADSLYDFIRLHNVEGETLHIMYKGFHFEIWEDDSDEKREVLDFVIEIPVNENYAEHFDVTEMYFSLPKKYFLLSVEAFPLLDTQIRNSVQS